MTAMSIDRIDPARAKEATALCAGVAAVAAAINAEHAAKVGHVGTALPAAWTAAEIQALVEQLGDAGAIFCCQDRGNVVGFAVVQPDREDAATAIMGVWVHAGARRRGIGTELARTGTEFARERGYSKLRGTIPAYNEPALSFFSAVGPIVQLEAGAMGYELPI